MTHDPRYPPPGVPPQGWTPSPPGAPPPAPGIYPASPPPPHGVHPPALTPPPAPPTRPLSPYGGWQTTTQVVSPPRRGLPRWVIAVAAGTAVASVIAFVAVLLWPRGESIEDTPPLAFQGFAQTGTVVFDQPSRTTLATVYRERGYVAWEQGGQLQVVRVDPANGQVQQRVALAGAPQWGRILAGPEALFVFGYADAPDQPRPMFVLDPETLQTRWQRNVRGEDELFFFENVVGWLDLTARKLYGLDLAGGSEAWVRDLPVEGDVSVVNVVGQAELAQPTDQFGLVGGAITDHRLVLVEADSTVRVIDGNNGTVITEATNVAEPGDQVLGYGDRLFVAPDEGGYGLASYDLTNLRTVPQTHYTAADDSRFPERLAPCGAERVCVLESRSYDSATMEVVAVDLAGGGAVWRRPAPEAEWLLPVGDWVAAVIEPDFNARVIVYNGSGDPVLDQAGFPVRTTGRNLMVFSDGISADLDEPLSAVGLTAEPGTAPVELGRLPDVLEQFCAWGDRFLICPTQDSADIWRFADEE